MKTAQHLLATLAAVIACLLPLTAQAETFEETRARAEQGDADAQNKLGAVYANGQGVEKDQAVAVKWYRKAAEQGNSDAQYNLGGVVENFAEALMWYRKAAEQGNLAAQKHLALLLDVDDTNNDEVLKWLRKAAEQGDVWSIKKLGYCYATGSGVPKSESEALKLFRKTTKTDEEARRMFELCIDNYKNRAKISSDRVKDWRIRAEQGDGSAQFALGVCYELSTNGVVKNDLLAYQWCLLASANGHEMARKNVSAIEAKLTAEQRAEGQRLATEWQAAFEKRR